MSASPTCRVKDGSGSYATTPGGVNVTAGDTITINLTSSTGVATWGISCVYTDELLAAATITSGLTIDNTAKTATFTAPIAGSALIFQSVVNGGLDANGAVDATLTTTFGVYVLTSGGLRVGAANETTQGNSTFGTAATINASIRAGVSAAAIKTALGITDVTATSTAGAAATLDSDVLADAYVYRVTVGIVSRDTSNNKMVMATYRLLAKRASGTLTIVRSELVDEIGDNATVLLVTPFSGDVDAAVVTAAFSGSSGAVRTTLDPVDADNWKHSIRYEAIAVSNT